MDSKNDILGLGSKLLNFCLTLSTSVYFKAEDALTLGRNVYLQI